MTGETSPAHLLEIIDAQNEIASAGLDLDGVMDFVTRRALELTDAGAAVVEMADGDELVSTVAAGTAVKHLGMRVPLAGSLSGLCISTGQVLSCDNTDNDDRVDAKACAKVGAGSMICVPLTHGEIAVGVLKVYSPAIYDFRSKDVEILRLLSGLIGAHLAQAGDFQSAARNSRTDQLTGLGNRRAYDEALASEIARARRHDGDLSLCLIDLDDFESVNEELGHPAGDEILRAVAEILGRGRFSDAAFRLEGDDFAVILPETDLAGAKAAAGRIAQRIGAAAPGGTTLTASYGVAEGGPGAIELHARAAEALAAMKGSPKAAAASG